MTTATNNALNLLSPVWTHLTQIQPVRAEGIYLYDEVGTQYTDFSSGIGVTNTGHCHPAVVQAIKAQAEKLIFAQMNIVISPVTLALAKALNTVTPESINAFFFSNSGAEAIEGAVKLARHATGRKNIIVFQGSFHGRTAQTMAMTTSKTIYSQGYQPLPSGVFATPFPNSYYYGWDEEETTDFCLKQLKLLFKGQTPPEHTAAIVIEPILGEGGYVHTPPGFLQALREVCYQHDILLIADEVQSGFGRSGKFFSFEHAAIEPDIIVMAKGLGSGLPISAIGSKRYLMDNWTVGSHGGTYGGGSAIAIAAAVATLKVIKEEKLVENAKEQGDYLLSRLRNLQKRYPVIGDVRGLGLMVGTEFTTAEGEPDKKITKAVQAACVARNLLILSCGTFENIMRWIPPLIVTKKQIDDGVAIFEAALQEVVG